MAPQGKDDGAENRGTAGPGAREMRRRLAKSLATGLAVCALAGGAWHWIRTQPADGGIPRFLRQTHGWNERLWRGIYDPGRLNRAAEPAPGKSPRVNGHIGLVEADDEDDFDPARWSMDVIVDDAGGPAGGAGAPPPPKALHLTMADLRWMPKTNTASEFRCIEGWRDVIAYGGVRFSDFLRLERLPTHYRYVGLATPDGKYYVSIDMDSMLHPQTMLAYEMNGAPLSIRNGAPLRLVIPVKYGIKSLKRVGRILLSNRRPPDYWAERGYDWYAGL